MRWVPLPLDYILAKYGLNDSKVKLLLLTWIITIAGSLYSISLGKPVTGFLASSPNELLYYSYITHIPLLIGTLLLFWLGFEWGFIPVFLSAFVIAFLSQMTYYWALLYGVAFILGLAIYALAYYCVPIDASLRSLKGIAFFTVVSFIAALAGSLGSFVWSQFFQLSAWETLLIWKSWWTGAFLQSMVLIAPILALLTPTVIRLRNQYFKETPAPKVTLNWIYAAIGSVALVLILFIIGAKTLGSQSLISHLSSLSQDALQAVQSANESFEIVTWISVGLILIVGITGIYLVGGWNEYLQDKVDQQTIELKESEAKLKKALGERDLLLQEIHDRVSYNLTMMLALLELQLKTEKEKNIEEIIKDSHSRIRSMAIIHETMHQAGSVSTVNLKNYTIKLSNRLRQSFLSKFQNIDVTINVDDITLGIERAVPFAMVLNELMVNAYTHAFKNLKRGTLFVEIKKSSGDILLNVRDNGNGLPDNFSMKEQQSLGMKLIHTLTKQLQGDFKITDYNKPCFSLRMPIEASLQQEHEEAY